ncbi:MAG: endonuclease MutS2 [Vallitaleaceae bacterium]|nr:endonuclease MutS2 [Vallitaleaceae bacterium]
MNKKALETLEFNKIKIQLAEKASTPSAKKLARDLEPYTDIKHIETAQLETEDSTSLILKHGSLPIGRVGNISSIAQRLKLEASLSIPEFLVIASLLRATKRIKSYSSQSDQIQDLSIAHYFENLVNLNDLYREINRCIVSEEEIADDASSELSRIRKAMSIAHDRIKTQLGKIISSKEYSNMLQDAIVTIKNDRYCVPIKAEHKNNFKGMIHDHSASGATVFIEPLAIVELNNKIHSLLSDEEKEIERILQNLSEMAAPDVDILVLNTQIITKLDFIFAKGELALKMRATKPIFNKVRYINLKKARHPLLDPKTVVPTDIYIGREFTSLVVTGPNTGGKTVTLKTVGLLSIMGQSGLHIPALDRSELAIFTEIYADIGDEQSIEQSLSSFSSHMVNIVHILDHADYDSLVLFDELGAGTDPVEGAALAMAILGALFNKSIRTLATTHYSELKEYALSTKGIENASCEFDINTLSPTYKLLIGIPGKSNAFAISKRLGLKSDIIEASKLLIEGKAIRFEDLITDLETNKKSVIIEKDKAERYRTEALTLKEKVEAQEIKLLAQRELKLKEAKKEAYEIIEAAKKEADEIIRAMRDTSGYDSKSMEQNRSKLRDKMSQLSDDLYQKDAATNTHTATPSAASISKGDTVYVTTFEQEGLVLEPPNVKGDLVVQMGIMKTNVNISQIRLVNSKDATTSKSTKKTSTTRASLSKVQHIKTELDLRGETIESGLGLLDKYLDDAYLSNLPIVTIIHGKGTGALRTAIQQHLRKVKYVKSYRLGEYGEGESGVTVVTFKE